MGNSSHAAVLLLRLLFAGERCQVRDAVFWYATAPDGSIT